jgi:type 1 glutamine amidotransferase
MNTMGRTARQLFWLLLLATAMSVVSPSRAAEKIRVLIVTGGHEFETNQFFQMFKDNPEITFQAVEHPRAHTWLDPESARRFDVLVLYDMWQGITGPARTNLLAWLKRGKGVVALHHSLANYQAWDEYAQIIGGKYYLEKTTNGAVDIPPSTFLHDVHVHVRVADQDHPVTRGVKDFDIVDETYGRFRVNSDAHALLTTDAPTSSPVIGWTQPRGKARVVYLQLGHNHTAYEHPAYRQLLAQAIRWTANSD